MIKAVRILDTITEMITTSFLGQTNNRLQKTYKEMMHALWMVLTGGEIRWMEKCEAAERAYQNELTEASFQEQVNSLIQLGNHLKVLDLRQLVVLSNDMLEHHASSEMRDKITSIWNDLHYMISTHRAEVEGAKLSEKEILHLLGLLESEEKRKQFWLASMQIGEKATSKLLELVELRNETARQKGFENYYEMKMAAQEMNSAWIDEVIQALRKGLDPTYRKVKADIDDDIVRRFKIPHTSIRSWHYPDPFFQKHDFEVDSGEIYDSELIQTKIMEWFAKINLDITELMNHADLSARNGKSQANCCLHIDRSGDIRVSCNLTSDKYSETVFLHELGHACYEMGIGQELPFILKQPAHPFLSEAVALMFERRATNSGWRNILVRLYWSIALVQFERRLYENPRQPLNALWWDIVEDVQGIKRPEEWDYPYWAAKAHLSTLPVYYHNYLLGEVAASQIQHSLEATFGSSDCEAAFEHLKKRMFSPGISVTWQNIMHRLSGSELKVDFLVEQLATAHHSS